MGKPMNPARDVRQPSSSSAARGGMAAKKKKPVEATKEEVLKQALAAAFSTSAEDSAEHQQRGGLNVGSVDVYGKGLPTDRLQFGYSPAVVEEAVAFHSQRDAPRWVVARRARFPRGSGAQDVATPPHFEPFASVLKLQAHWAHQAKFQAHLHGSTATVAEDSADELLNLLASKQRVA